MDSNWKSILITIKLLEKFSFNVICKIDEFIRFKANVEHGNGVF